MPFPVMRLPLEGGATTIFIFIPLAVALLPPAPTLKPWLGVPPEFVSPFAVAG